MFQNVLYKFIFQNVEENNDDDDDDDDDDTL
jgi:hypothetical protein